MNEILEEIYIQRVVPTPQSKPKKTVLQIILKGLFLLLFLPIAIIVILIKFLRSVSNDDDKLRALESYNAKLGELASLRDQGLISQSDFYEANLECLTSLRKQGAISQSEFSRIKKGILRKIIDGD